MVRTATVADVPAFIALQSESPTAAHWSREQYLTIFSTELARIALVLENDDAIQGFLIARPVGREWELENIVISNSNRRRGLGSRLLQEFLEAARSQCAASVFLEVRESNAAARRLYEKRGFVESGRRPAYYHDPEEAAVLYRLDFCPVPQTWGIPSRTTRN